MRTLLVVLQNEYRQNGQEIPREAWLHNLWASHTGRRLVEMLPRGCQVEVVNASPLVGTEVSSSFPADPAYIAEMIAWFQPSMILACGKIAQAGVKKLKLQHVAAPHPP